MISDHAKALCALEEELVKLESESKKTLRMIKMLRARFLNIGDCQVAVLDAIDKLKAESLRDKVYETEVFYSNRSCSL